jgi:hypothetical protein
LDDDAFGAASDVVPKFVSPSGPAAQWTGAMRGPAFFAYADNYLIDVKFGIIMDVEATRAIRQAEVAPRRPYRARQAALRHQARAAGCRYGLRLGSEARMDRQRDGDRGSYPRLGPLQESCRSEVLAREGAVLGRTLS